jgi:hypothetical protein
MVKPLIPCSDIYLHPSNLQRSNTVDGYDNQLHPDKQPSRLTSIGMSMTVTSLLGSGGSRGSRGGAFTVIVVVVEDATGRLGRGSGNVGAGGGRRSGSGRGSRSRDSGRGGGVRVVVVILVSDTCLTTASDLESIDIYPSVQPHPAHISTYEQQSTEGRPDRKWQKKSWSVRARELQRDLRQSERRRRW